MVEVIVHLCVCVSFSPLLPSAETPPAPRMKYERAVIERWLGDELILLCAGGRSARGASANRI